MYIPDEVVEEIRQRNDIVDVVGSYVRLQRKGANYFGLCPFHNEKSPSFSVSPQKQMYYCFGCGAGGNVISFVMQYENEDFTEAARYLADRAGVTIPETESSSEERQKAGIRAQLMEINKKAAVFYVYQMNKTEEGARARQYLLDRGLTPETISRFGLGYSPMYADALYQYLKGEGFRDEILKQSGLFTYSEKGVFDRFFNRVIYPILDTNNKVIGFGGRVMGKGEPKYLNSPETVAFDKSRNLFGLHEAKRAKETYMLVCEGYMDVISMHQAGFNNSVASLGTALTDQQAKLLKRYTEEVILTYDSDGAGQKAALRAIPIFRRVGIRTKVLNMKPHKDPDEFIKNLGAEAFRQRIDNAMNSFIFEIYCLQAKYHMDDPTEKTQFYRDTAKKLLQFSEELERTSYIEAVSREFRIPYENLRELVFTTSNSEEYKQEQARERLRKEREAERQANQTPEQRAWQERYQDQGPMVDDVDGGMGVPKPKKITRSQSGLLQSAKLLLTWIADEPAMYPIISKYVAPEDFEDALTVEVAKQLYAQAEKGAINPGQILNTFVSDEENYAEVSSMFFSSIKENITDEKREQFLNDTVRKIRRNSLEQRSKAATSFEELQQIMKEQKELDKMHIKLD